MTDSNFPTTSSIHPLSLSLSLSLCNLTSSWTPTNGLANEPNIAQRIESKWKSAWSNFYFFFFFIPSPKHKSNLLHHHHHSLHFSLSLFPSIFPCKNIPGKLCVLNKEHLSPIHPLSDMHTCWFTALLLLISTSATNSVLSLFCLSTLLCRGSRRVCVVVVCSFHIVPFVYPVDGLEMIWWCRWWWSWWSFLFLPTSLRERKRERKKGWEIGLFPLAPLLFQRVYLQRGDMVKRSPPSIITAH